MSWMKGLKTGQLSQLQEKGKVLLAEDLVSPSKSPGGGKQQARVTGSHLGLYLGPHLCSESLFFSHGAKNGSYLKTTRHCWVLFLKSSAYFDDARRRKRLGKCLRHGTEEVPLLEDYRRLWVSSGDQLHQLPALAQCSQRVQDSTRQGLCFSALEETRA